MYLSNMGYKSYCNTEVSASFAVSISPNTRKSRMNSGVFVFNGHAGPGSCQFQDSYKKSTYLTAIKSGGKYTKFGNINLQNCKVAFFFGCKTASKSRESKYGVLTDKAVEKGADCSFGWKKSVNTSTATKFRDRMFYFLSKGYSVKKAASSAASEMPWNDATRKYRISGNTKKKLCGSSSNVSTNVKTITGSMAKREMQQLNYVFMEHQEDGSKLYVRYIDNIPTMESIEISSDGTSAVKSNISFCSSDIKQIKNMRVKKVNISRYVPSTIVDGGIKFSKIGKSEDMDVYCKVKGKTKFVKIVNTEYVSQDKECYYLDTVCIDMETGNQINYADIVAGVN